LSRLFSLFHFPFAVLSGNVCLWPSEEVLAFFACHNADLFAKKRVLELGAGSNGLAGLSVPLVFLLLNK
jgi:hypothetical protein